MEKMDAEIRIQRLLEALKAAQYYVSRLERYRDGLTVRDLAEAEGHYRSEALSLIEAYEREARS